ncbi:hypothetical protein AV521_20545 [Streptomyces sp. IMTB 2501]|uniref:hypothetical protein n=1 Tax=Streptomyces sp. IMTB 2501 TaxID=1776340 RepID=UPI00096D0E61|nr:hypothetical protein [Streptomyces sp. IMTB 2501]OLZ68544.1 hypothetical protein AV521_20545 [Streptomyces sp. IMTB 2501]
MASIRTARVLAAVAALPLAAALFSGVAAADNGSFAGNGSSANTGVAGVIGSGVGHNNFGNSSTTQQNAVGNGASSQSNAAQANNSAFAPIQQGSENVAIDFTHLW